MALRLAMNIRSASRLREAVDIGAYHRYGSVLRAWPLPFDHSKHSDHQVAQNYR
jgi:hypothetical protein